MTVVSVDLAYRDYRDYGMVVLEDGPSGAQYELLPFAQNSTQAPTPERAAEIVLEVCGLVVESLPLRAWRSLGLRCLPAKSKACTADIHSHWEELIGLGIIAEGGATPTHDQLQALVAGLGGLGVLAGAPDRYEAVGTKPFSSADTWREGYIVSPTLSGARQ